MLIDADTHFVPIDVYSKINPEYACRLSANFHTTNLDPAWRKVYAAIKDPGWPDMHGPGDWRLLPLDIRAEIKFDHRIDGLHVSDDLEYIFFDPADNSFPSLDTAALSGQYIFHTDQQIVTPHGNFLSYRDSCPDAVSFMWAYNETMQAITKSNARWQIVMWLPLQDFRASMDYLESNNAKDFFGVHLIDHHPWGYIREVRPLFEHCARKKIPIYLHLSLPSEDSPKHWTWNYHDSTYRLLYKQFPPARFQEHGMAWQATILGFITSGLLDDLPDLRIVSTEHGLEWLPSARIWCHNHQLPDPLPYLQNNFWFTMEPEEPNFLSNARLLGWDRLLYASDYPHNDRGGKNRFLDLDMLTAYQCDGQISPLEFDLFAYKNFQKLSNRI